MSPPSKRTLYLLEFYSTFLMSFATLMQAWCAYEDTRWSGQMKMNYSAASAAHTEASARNTEANLLINMDVGLFVQFVTAWSEGNWRLVHFLEKRFRPEAKIAVDAWIKTQPLKNPNAPSTPFVMKEYSLKARADAAESEKTFTRKNQEANRGNQSSVFFTGVTFLAGISSKFESLHARAVLLMFGTLVFLGASYFLITLPIAP